MKKILLLAIILTSSAIAGAQTIFTFQLGDTVAVVSGLAGNGITDIKATDTVLWLGTGHGLSRYQSFNQQIISFDARHGLGHGSVSALYVRGETILIATATDTVTEIQAEPFPKGTGISLSFDGGLTWRHVPQPGPTPIQNVTYDIEVFNGTIWITSWG
ncbi:hypothetical protein JXO59_07990, partial [candidate division KSB1 bacterium]|nr:hypothetical protein [candidate division KSB1 bacterium]